MIEHKKESIIILGCIISILICYLLYWIYTVIIKLINKTTQNNKELFSSNNSKREKMKKIYGSDEILDNWPTDVRSLVYGYYD